MSTVRSLASMAVFLQQALWRNTQGFQPSQVIKSTNSETGLGFAILSFEKVAVAISACCIF